MQPIFYVIALMGCTDDGQACQQQRVEPVHYLTPAACEAAVPDALGRNADLDYPTIEASCRASGLIMVDNGKAQQRRG